MLAVIMRAQNIEALDFPLEASLHSASLIADEIVLAVAEDQLDSIIPHVNVEAPCTLRIVPVHGGYDADWQVRFWDAAIDATKADWFFLMDADECLLPGMWTEINAAMRSGKLFASFPFVHFYGTANYVIEAPRFYKWHTRLGQRGRYFMSNERIARKGAPICDMIGITPAGQKLIHVAGMEYVYQSKLPIHHYGWCRDDLAFVHHRELGYLVYGVVQTTPEEILAAPSDEVFDMDSERQYLTRFTGTHPEAMDTWRFGHSLVWRERERNYEA